LGQIGNQNNDLGLFRLTQDNLVNGNFRIQAAIGNLNNKDSLEVDKNYYNKVIKNNILLLKAIDTGTNEGKIKLDSIQNYDVEALISQKTSRNQIQIIFKNSIEIQKQQDLITLFNDKINEMRDEYFSLFMTNFRDKDRKRISFNFAYKLINYLYFEELEKSEFLI